MSDAGQKNKGQAKGGQRGDPREAAKAEKKAAKRENKSAGTQVAVGERAHDPHYVPRFKQRYNDVIRQELMKQFGYKDIMQVPRINKVGLNIGAGGAAPDSKKNQQEQNDLT